MQRSHHKSNPGCGDGDGDDVDDDSGDDDDDDVGGGGNLGDFCQVICFSHKFYTTRKV